MAHKGMPWLAFVLALLISGVAAAGEAADEPTALTTLVKTLHDQGVIDEQEYTDISAQGGVGAGRARPPAGGSGSRSGATSAGRYEGFFYQRDPDGERLDNQQRGRYRLRLGLASQINDYARVVLQFATGAGDNRSGNQTFGGNLDWGKDLIEVDLAYLELNPFPHDGQLPLDSNLFVDVGRMPNAFLWKNGRDVMLWDNDINLEGVDFRFTARPGEAIDVFANTGFFIDDENSGAKDPSLYAAQLGANARANDRLTIGGRVSFFQFLSLNEAFVERAASSSNGPSVTTGGGNILDGLTGSATGGEAGILATAAYLRCTCFEAWPVTLYGSFSNNLSAESSVLFPRSGQGVAWRGWWGSSSATRSASCSSARATSTSRRTPSLRCSSRATSSTARPTAKGWVVYGSREIFKNTDLNLTAFLSDAIDKATPAFDDSISGAHRVRLQADVLVKF